MYSTRDLPHAISVAPASQITLAQGLGLHNVGSLKRRRIASTYDVEAFQQMSIDTGLRY